MLKTHNLFISEGWKEMKFELLELHLSLPNFLGFIFPTDVIFYPLVELQRLFSIRETNYISCVWCSETKVSKYEYCFFFTLS